MIPITLKPVSESIDTEKNIVDYFNSFNIFSSDEIDDITRSAKPITLRKNDYLVKTGQVCNHVAFLTKGMLRSFYHSSEEEEITYCFTLAGELINAYSSFITQEKTKESIQALTESELLIISREEITRLERSSYNWLSFSKLMAEQQYLRLEKRVFMLQKEKAEKRYESLMKNNPEYLQYIPLNYLASYLGITQRHLSRIRREFTVF